MNKPEIKLNQVAYVQVSNDVLAELRPYAYADGINNIIVNVEVLDNQQYRQTVESAEIVIFIDQVLEQVIGIDIIFHL